MTYTIDGIAYGVVAETERCPCCGEYLWEEWGYWSWREMLIWDYWYYPLQIGRDMGVSHYREVVE